MFSMSDGSTPIEPAPAATVLVTRETNTGLEVLLLKRHRDLAFMPGAWVFPGGKVDEGDAGSSDLERARSAAVREVYEEAGIHVVADRLLTFSHWLTPEGVSRRFSTWFFVATLTSESPVTVCGSEIVDHQWITPADALAQHREGGLAMPPPTYVSLWELARHSSLGELYGSLADSQPAKFFPKVIPLQNDLCFLYAGDAGYTTGEPTLPGSRHRTMMVGGILDYQRE
jgi:8-oxo-dGTP pyrophosphatase MutT (NUDIX family)